jgi:ABC-type transporter Mla subunit MlaD
MTQPTAGPESDEGAMSGPDRGTRPTTPRWVKVFAVVALVAVLLLVVLLVVGGGEHGPTRHTGNHAESGALNGHTAPAGAHL